MKKKRYIMQDTALTTYTAPTVLAEEYDNFDENELYRNERLSRKDFARSIY